MDKLHPGSIIIGSFAMSMINLIVSLLSMSGQEGSFGIKLMTLFVTLCVLQGVGKITRGDSANGIETIQAYVELIIFQELQLLQWEKLLGETYAITCYIIVLYVASRFQGYIYTVLRHISTLLLTTTIGNIVLERIHGNDGFYTVIALVLVLVVVHAVVRLVRSKQEEKKKQVNVGDGLVKI